MESTNTILNGLMSGNTSVFITGKTALILSIVSLVVSVLIAFLGLKLIRVWNALTGLVIGAVIGLVAGYLIGLEAVPVLIVTVAAGLILAILCGVFKRFGAFFLCFFGVSGVLYSFIKTENWIVLAVFFAIGLIFAILAMIWFEPFVIIATALDGGFGAGMVIVELAKISNEYMTWAICAVIIILGIVLQFIMKSSEINKKEVKRANAIKKETSKEEEIEMARTMLIDLDDDDDEDE